MVLHMPKSSVQGCYWELRANISSISVVDIISMKTNTRNALVQKELF